ncbi:MAG TPA: serine hydrolase domain-containing protein [Ktedonobacterales bacterium]|nr:serine hydrolase domain-containing protein [Ktedonobacterales bacterium]
MEPQSSHPAAKTHSAVHLDFELLHEQIVAAMQRLHVPGVALGILHEGKQHTAGFGVTNANYPSPVSSDTLFQIGSITKTLTATAIMRLVEAGTLDLDTPVRTYVPDLALADESVAEGVSLRHLLTHTAGWEGDFALLLNTGRGDDALARFIAMLPQAQQLTPLGMVWSYNNAGFYLAGRVLEAVTGKPYETAATELVLDPLGMSHSHFFPEQVMLNSFAVGHNASAEAVEVARPWPIPRNANAAGGITATAGDLLRYARFHMSAGTAADGTHVLSRASLNLMQTPQVEAGARRSVGLSWFIEDWNGVRVLGHDGGTIGQVARLRFVPARNFALAILTNADRGGDLMLEVTRWVLRHYLGVTEPERIHQPRTPEQLAGYAGHYVATLTLADLTLRDGVLVLETRDSDRIRELIENPPPPPPPSPVAFYGEDIIIATEGPLKDMTAEFLRNPDGGIAWLRLGGRLYRREA